MEKQFKLPRVFAEKWVTALRSGEYQQSTQYLYYHSNKHGDEYCCLGVACVVSGIEKGFIEDYLLIDDSLPFPIPESIPVELIGNRGVELIRQLTDMNDSYGRSFEEIANWIEQNVELY